MLRWQWTIWMWWLCYFQKNRLNNLKAFRQDKKYPNKNSCNLFIKILWICINTKISRLIYLSISSENRLLAHRVVKSLNATENMRECHEFDAFSSYSLYHIQFKQDNYTYILFSLFTSCRKSSNPFCWKNRIRCGAVPVQRYAAFCPKELIIALTEQVLERFIIKLCMFTLHH